MASDTVTIKQKIPLNSEANVDTVTATCAAGVDHEENEIGSARVLAQARAIMDKAIPGAKAKTRTRLQAKEEEMYREKSAALHAERGEESSVEPTQVKRALNTNMEPIQRERQASPAGSDGSGLFVQDDKPETAAVLRSSIASLVLDGTAVPTKRGDTSPDKGPSKIAKMSSVSSPTAAAAATGTNDSALARLAATSGVAMANPVVVSHPSNVAADTNHPVTNSTAAINRIGTSLASRGAANTANADVTGSASTTSITGVTNSVVAGPVPITAADTNSTASGFPDNPPAWYDNTPHSRSRAKGTSEAEILLMRLRDGIKKTKQAQSTQEFHAQSKLFQDTLDILHKLAFVQVNESLLKKNRILHNAEGIRQIFDGRYAGGVHWPWYVQEDGKELYSKWARRVFDTDLLRGIKLGKPGKNKDRDTARENDQLQKDYAARVSAHRFGGAHLTNGQWFPTQLCTIRDGAHGVSQGGIAGEPGVGAWSVVLTGNPLYPDQDDGHTVFYCGTDSTDGKVTPGTRLLLNSLRSQKPVRLLRSHNLKQKSPYAPELGFRYDGLYTVVAAENIDGPDSKRQRHRFKMERNPGQPLIRGGVGPHSRPTPEEVDACKNDKRFRGFK